MCCSHWQHYLFNSKHVVAVILCHRVNTEMSNMLIHSLSEHNITTNVIINQVFLLLTHKTELNHADSKMFKDDNAHHVQTVDMQSSNI